MGTGPSRPQSVDEAIARLASARHGVFSRADAFGCGATDGTIKQRLASGRWTRLHQGVYRIAGAPTSWRQTVMAACLAGGSGAVASHPCAARLWELPGVARKPAPEIMVLKGHAPRRAGLIVHETRRLPPVDVTSVDGIPVTTAARTLVDCAAIWNPEVLEEAIDDAIRRGLVSLSQLRWRARELARPGRARSGTLRRVLASRGGQSTPGSVLERRFLRLLARARLPLPEPQYQIRESGRLIARVDFAYPAALVAIEADGYRYHSGRIRWQRDLTRRNALTSRGWRIIHVTGEDLARRGDEVCGAVARALAYDQSDPSFGRLTTKNPVDRSSATRNP